MLRRLFVSKETDHNRAKKFINSGKNDVWAYKSLGVCIAINNMFSDIDWHREQLRKHKISTHSKKRFKDGDWWGSDEGDHIKFTIKVGSLFAKKFKYEAWVTDRGYPRGPVSESEEGRTYRRVTLKCNDKDCIKATVSQWMDNIHWDLELIDYCVYDTEWNAPLQRISEKDPLFF